MSEILRYNQHRPWPLKDQSWVWYQQWNKVVFLHYQVSSFELQKFIPAGLNLDTLNGHAWISVVAFTMNKIRPRFCPYFPPVSDFHEVNVRTYVVRDSKPGVYFISIDAEKLIPVLIAGNVSGLPYEKSHIQRKENLYQAENANRSFSITYRPGKYLEKDAVDLWLTERYCLYLQKGGNLFRYDIHHPEWFIQQVEIRNLKIRNKQFLLLGEALPARVHYSEGVEVLAWPRERLKG